MAEPTLSQLMAEIRKANKRLEKLDKQVSGLEKDMKKVLKCVATDNADFEVRIKSNTSSGTATVPMAASSK